MSTEKKTAPIDLFEEAMAVNVGAPLPATLFGVTFNIRRNYTGDEVAAYIGLFTADAEKKTIKEQIAEQLNVLTDLAGDAFDTLVDKLLAVPIVTAQSLLVKIGQRAGLRGADTGFLTGTHH